MFPEIIIYKGNPSAIIQVIWFYSELESE